MINIIRFIHLMSLIVWLGGMVFFSFIVAPSIFQALPTETAGDVVGVNISEILAHRLHLQPYHTRYPYPFSLF